MSDETLEQGQKSPTTHPEMAATPFGGTRPDDEAQAETPESEPVQEQEAEAQPEAIAEEPQAEAEEAKPEPVEEPMSMEQAMASAGGTGVDYSGTFKSLTEGDVVDGVVVHIDRDGVLVDVGTKSEGTIRLNELSRDPNLAPEDVVAVGDRIKVYVVETESRDGGPVLSKKRADFENAWERVQKAHGTGEVLKAMVTDRVKGGLVVDLGIRGFVPASHVGSGKIKNLERYVGQAMPFKVIEVDRERRKVVLSHRLAVEEERESMRKTTMTELAEGQIREGVVRRITDYGAFVDLGGVDGLLHVSEMSWTRINHPSEAVKVGGKIQVMILKLDLGNNRISLGLRQILPDPWNEINRIHTVGDVIKGTVTRIVPFGAFVQVEGGVEGIIPNSELAVRRISRPEDVVSSGQEVEVKVIDLRPDERRMTLSLRQLASQREREQEETEYRTFTQTRSEGKTTIGDLIGDQLGDLTASVAPAEKQKRKSRARAAKREAMEEAEALAETDLLEEAPMFAETEEAEAEPEAGVVAETETEVAEVEVEAEVAAETEEEVGTTADAEVEAEAETATEAEAEAVEAVEAEEVGEEPAAEASDDEKK